MFLRSTLVFLVISATSSDPALNVPSDGQKVESIQVTEKVLRELLHQYERFQLQDVDLTQPKNQIRRLKQIAELYKKSGIGRFPNTSSGKKSKAPKKKKSIQSTEKVLRELLHQYERFQLQDVDLTQPKNQIRRLKQIAELYKKSGIGRFPNTSSGKKSKAPKKKKEYGTNSNNYNHGNTDGLENANRLLFRQLVKYETEVFKWYAKEQAILRALANNLDLANKDKEILIRNLNQLSTIGELGNMITMKITANYLYYNKNTSTPYVKKNYGRLVRIRDRAIERYKNLGNFQGRE